MEIHLGVVLLLIAAVSLGFFLQTIVGFAASLIAFPLLLFVFDLKQANAIMSVFYVLFSLILIFKNRKDVDKQTLWQLCIGTALGTLAGIYLLKNLNPFLLKKLLGVFSLVYAVIVFREQKKIKILDKLGVLIGFVGGIISGLFAAGSQAYVPYLDSKLDSSKTARATLIAILGISNFIRLPSLLFTKILTLEIFKFSLLALPFFLLSLYLGQKVLPRVKDNILRKIVLCFLIISGGVLIIK